MSEDAGVIDLSPWAAMLGPLFSQGMESSLPAAMQRQLADQASGLLEQALATAAPAPDEAAPWRAVREEDSLIVILDAGLAVARFEGPSLLSLRVEDDDGRIWSVIYPGRGLQSMLGSAFDGQDLGPEVKIAVLEQERCLASWTFFADGSDQDDRDFQGAVEEDQRRLGESPEAALPEEGAEPSGGELPLGDAGPGDSGEMAKLLGAGALGVLGALGGAAIFTARQRARSKRTEGAGAVGQSPSPPALASTPPQTPPRPAEPLPALRWHYVFAGLPVGPVEESELRGMLAKGALSGDTLVWNPTLPEWRPATAVGLVKPVALAPPLPPSSSLRETPTQPHPPAPAAASPGVRATCSRCNAALDPGLRFCVNCGAPVSTPSAGPPLPVTPLPRTCPRCRSAVGSSDRFCPECGSRVE
jgi:Double zinc ribbon/GYF domain 2